MSGVKSESSANKDSATRIRLAIGMGASDAEETGS